MTYGENRNSYSAHQGLPHNHIMTAHYYFLIALFVCRSLSRGYEFFDWMNLRIAIAAAILIWSLRCTNAIGCGIRGLGADTQCPYEMHCVDGLCVPYQDENNARRLTDTNEDADDWNPQVWGFWMQHNIGLAILIFLGISLAFCCLFSSICCCISLCLEASTNRTAATAVLDHPPVDPSDLFSL